MTTLQQLIPLLKERPDLDYVLSGTGSSMIPTIVRGDRLHIRKLAEPPRPGDILICQDVIGRYLIHRVVQTKPELRTQGDAVNELDPPIQEVLGIVYLIEKTWLSRLRRIKLRVVRIKKGTR
jgi:phage repressor protein C with HTH and peptisase S24 domain